MRKPVAALLALSMVCFVLSGVGGCTKPAEKPKEQSGPLRLSIATGGVAGVYYPLGGAIASVINTKMKNANCSVETTGGSVANIHLIKGGSANLAFSAANVFYDAVKGIGAFKDQKVESARAILSLYPEAVQIVTLADSGIKTVNDLKGKKVAVGDMGSGTELMAREILKLYGMTYDDITEDYLGFSEAANGLKDRTIAAGFIWAGVPTAGIMDLTSQNKISLVQIDEARINDLTQRLPYCTVMKIVGGTYKGLDTEVTTIAIPAILIGRADLSDEFVYSLLKAIFDNKKMLEQAHVRGKDISLQTALNGLKGIPLHPGAERFFKEAGLLK
ncbi:MAG: TAXI family TRAP transporter solute-binding subunit [Firmicutes bacterium]|nr:TAXI family TRAP transporter solute-binding subunit [Bacillota bacterium]